MPATDPLPPAPTASPGASPQRQGRPRRRRTALTITFATIAVGALIVVATIWRHYGGRPKPLPPDWPAYVRVLAGTGRAVVVDGPAWEAGFAAPFGITVSGDGVIYVVDAGDHPCIRRITADGSVTTIAGGTRGFRDGQATVAAFDTPSALAVGSDGTLFVADTGNHAIRRVTPDGVVSTLAGDGQPGYRDGRGTGARFNGPVGVAVDAHGRVIVADTYNDRIRAIAGDGSVATLAGSGAPGSSDGLPGEAQFNTPSGVAVGSDGTIYVADTGNHAIRALDPGITAVRALDVSGLDPFLHEPVGLVASPGGDVFVTDRYGVVEAHSAGRARRLAGRAPGFIDGDGNTARFRRASGVAWVAAGQLLLADTGNRVVRSVSAAGRAVHLPPRAPLISPGFDIAAFALTPLLWPVDPMDGPHEIAGTLGEARGDGGDRPDRLHAGIDIHEAEGTPVLAVRDAVVDSPIAVQSFGTLNESLLIGDIRYVHIRVGRTHGGEIVDPDRFLPVEDERGELLGMRVRRGTRFRTGVTVGTVNRFYHVHLNVGWPGEEVNPLLLRLPHVEDTIPPTIAPRGIMVTDEAGVPFDAKRKGRLLVADGVHVLVDAWDQVNGNVARRRLGVYRLGYQLLTASGSPVDGFDTPRETIRLDRLGPDRDIPFLLYAPGSGIPFYGQRRTRFIYQVTNTYRDGAARAGSLDLGNLPRGSYVIRVLVADAFGNEALSGRDLPIEVVSAEEARATRVPPPARRRSSGVKSRHHGRSTLSR